MGELPEGARGRVLALLLLLVVVAGAWTVVAQPLLDWYAARADRLSLQEALARRMGQVAAELPALRRLESGTEVAAPVSVLDGATDAVAGATLQQLLQSIAADAGATLASMEVLQGEQLAGYRRIGVRLAVAAPWPVVVKLLDAITGGSPRMLVNDLQIQGGRGVAGDGTPTLTTSMVVFGFRAGTSL
ncbi:MAG TPA: type II secretion system protein GspM [Acetobacteraceae bacterium]|nr:type II secretion system protein GspM [Acetobacteraceae bacterium]